MNFSKLTLIIVGLFLPLFSFADSVITWETPDTGDGLTCKVFLHNPENKDNKKMPLYFSQQGSGIYTRAFEQDNASYYFLVLDKPGIFPDPNNPDPNKPIVDHSKYDNYTQTDLSNCADSAIQWADNYLTQSRLAYNNLVYVRGHSEGSLIVTRWLEKQFENNSKFKNRIGGIFLSGVPMEDFATLYQYEFDQKQIDKDAFWEAYKNKDSAKLVQLTDLGYNWIHESFSLKSLTETFNELLNFGGSAVPIEIFQGLKDESVPSKSVLNFEDINNQNTQNKKPAFTSLNIRYYNAGHLTNEAGLEDLFLHLNAIQ